MTHSATIFASTDWIAARSGDDTSRVRLFCFAHAGGSAALYRTWPQAMPPEIDLCLLQLPGRGARIMEPPYRDMASLLTSLQNVLAPLLDRPFAFFGHSMGGVIAYAATHALHGTDGQEPAHLFVSARMPPYRVAPAAPLHHRSDQGLIDLIRHLGGAPADLLINPDLLATLLPIFRADLELLETYLLPSNSPRLSCPITVFGGEDDPMGDPEDLDAWAGLTRNRFNRQMFPGGHFYLDAQQGPLLARIAATLLG